MPVTHEAVAPHCRQSTPPTPHADAEPLCRHAPVASQHPEHVLGPHGRALGEQADKNANTNSHSSLIFSRHHDPAADARITERLLG